LALGACGGLPSDFEKLPLEKKVSAYKEHLQNYGRPLWSARSQISWHGWAAANLMAEYLDGRLQGFSEREAIQIIDLVQERGCSLRGTPAQESLERFLAREPSDSADYYAAKVTLEGIENDVVLPEGPDTLKGGPCQSRVRPNASP
jgi:hypothetical protein